MHNDDDQVDDVHVEDGAHHDVGDVVHDVDDVQHDADDVRRSYHMNEVYKLMSPSMILTMKEACLKE